MKAASIVLLILGIVALVIGFIPFFYSTARLQVDQPTMLVEKATNYTTQSGFLGARTNYYSQIQVKPTAAAKPSINYLLVADNGITKQNYKVSWNQQELESQQSKTITNKISQDQYIAFGTHKGFTTDTFEVRPGHQISNLVPALVILAIATLTYTAHRRRQKRQPYPGLQSWGGITTTPHSEGIGRIWYVYPNGETTDTPPPGAPPHIAGEPIESYEAIGQFKDMGLYKKANMEKLNELVREEKIKPGEARKFLRDIEERGDDFFSQKEFANFLEAIDDGTKSDRQEHDVDRLSDRINKKYGFDFKKFRF